MKKSILRLLLILLLTAGAGVLFLANKKEEYTVTVSDLKNTDFTQKVYQKNATYISGNKMLSSNGRYICYDAMEKGEQTALCSVLGCAHNNVDECMAIFDDTHLQEFICVYNQKLIVGGAGDDGLRFYSSDLDGSNHEKIAKSNFLNELVYNRENSDEKNKGRHVLRLECHDFLSFCMEGSKLYIGASVEDTTNTKQQKNGIMTGGPCISMIYILDLQTQTLEKLYEEAETSYSGGIELRYLSGEKLYFSETGSDLPSEDMYDWETNELKSPELRSHIMDRTGYMDLQTNEVTWLTGYRYMDYIGSRDGKRFFIELETETSDQATGEIRVEDETGRKTGTVKIKELKGLNYLESSIHVTQEGFVLNVPSDDWSKYAADVYLYDTSGKLTSRVARSSYSIIDEANDYYLLAVSYCSIGPTAYVKKDEVEELNKKAVAMYEKEE